MFISEPVVLSFFIAHGLPLPDVLSDQWQCQYGALSAVSDSLR
jgi:hypothetical protein